MPNIITAVFGGNSRYCTTRPVFQVDRGDVLKFVGLDLPEYYEVHFSNNKNALATRVLANGDSVVIPWEFMRHGQKEVFAWVYITPDAQTGYTPYQVTIPLNLRSDISDAQPTPAQEDIVAEAISALNEGVERTEQAADDAEEAVRHYPRIVNGYWQVWDVDTQQWQETGVKAVGEDGLPGRDGRDGVDGQDGAPGQDGADGYSPTATVTKSGSTATISITDKNGTTTATVSDGQDGAPGQNGQDGQDGAPGPNQVTTNTATNITGLLKGDGSTVSAATAGVDYALPTETVTVTGSTPTINAVAGKRYVCGEVTTLDITLPASGVVDVTFESGSTPTVLTITPPSGVTVKWANGFDPTALEANTVYNIRFTNGNLAVVTEWGESSGEGAEETFRKICDVTTEQDVASLTITKDMDGNSFKIKKWCAAVQIRSSATSALGVLIRLGTQPNSTIFIDARYGFDMSSPSSANKQNNYWACFEWVAGLNTWMPFGVMARDTGRNYGDQHTYPITPPVPNEWSYPPFATITERYMTAIKLIAYSTDPTIGAGTRIQVWGVDA